MTANEEQEFKIFQIIEKHNIERFNEHYFPAPLEKLLGDGGRAVLNNMCRDGHFSTEFNFDTNSNDYVFVSGGKLRYNTLKDIKAGEKKNVAINNTILLVTILTFILTIIDFFCGTPKH